MALIDYPDSSRLSDAANNVLKAYPNNLVRMLTGLGDAFLPLMGTIGAYVKNPLVSPRLRELITLRLASRLNGTYVLNQHESIARQIGMPEEAIAASSATLPSSSLSDTENHVLQLVDGLLGGKAAAESIRQVKDALGDEALQQIMLIHSLNCFLVTYSSSLEVDIDPPIELSTSQ